MFWYNLYLQTLELTQLNLWWPRFLCIFHVLISDACPGAVNSVYSMLHSNQLTAGNFIFHLVMRCYWNAIHHPIFISNFQIDAAKMEKLINGNVLLVHAVLRPYGKEWERVMENNALPLFLALLININGKPSKSKLHHRLFYLWQNLKSKYPHPPLLFSRKSSEKRISILG